LQSQSAGLAGGG